ncbi:hypothetical protein EZV62_004471 [Acer yangbiense]|uniref:Integrase catalytic domain-containing protein n=1 Tax=Acer yangbiense TaxID=1000413 RepID=A0A5C7IM26_9ROSI|nr:hypothetical protein EZV62_004471 [Acer yangbiense]
MAMVEDSMLNEEARRKEQGMSFESEALITERQGRSKSRRPQNREKSKDKSKGKFKSKIKCYHCGKHGHIIREYNYVNITSQDTYWVIDSGASFHVTSRRDLFTSYTDDDYGQVRMGNDHVSKIVGMGEICLEISTNCRLVLKNVRHVPDMRLNLISAGVLDDEGYKNEFYSGKWKLSKRSLVLARGKKESTLYSTQAKVSGRDVNTLSNNSSIELWHKRLGHMSEKGLQTLARREVLIEVKGTSLKGCVDCLAGKQHRVSFQKNSTHRKPNILDIVHSDVCGPMPTKSHGGARFFVTFIDDHSRKVWAYALKTKDQVLDMLKEFHVTVERETRKTLKCIRSDNGGE